MFGGVAMEVAWVIFACSAMVLASSVAWLIWTGKLKNLVVRFKDLEMHVEEAAQAAMSANHAVNSIGPGELPLKDRVTNVESSLTEVMSSVGDLHDGIDSLRRETFHRLDMMALAIVGKRVLEIEDEITGEHPVVQ